MAIRMIKFMYTMTIAPTYSIKSISTLSRLKTSTML